MGQLAVPMMIGAAVGGGTKLLQGKGLGSILKGAALGGAMGGATGGLMGGAGGITGAAGGTGAGLPQGASGLLSAGAENLAPTLIESATPLATSAASGSIGSDGLMQIGDTFYNPEYFANMGGSPIYTGAGSMLDKLSMGAQSVGSNFSNPFTNGMGVDNLTGAAQVASLYQPTPLQAAPSGRIEVGQAPTGAIYDELRKLGYAMPKRRETNFSLLG